MVVRCRSRPSQKFSSAFCFENSIANPHSRDSDNVRKTYNIPQGRIGHSDRIHIPRTTWKFHILRR
jgi:hypothetical protein